MAYDKKNAAPDPRAGTASCACQRHFSLLSEEMQNPRRYRVRSGHTIGENPEPAVLILGESSEFAATCVTNDPVVQCHLTRVHTGLELFWKIREF